mmetsp:Transcript_1860/g.4202  ORF Transcript_1860/g.4202 Transcript_1860/m.4202 type:complete len:206 (+) Transcript_1860:1445-2062(+)
MGSKHCFHLCCLLGRCLYDFTSHCCPIHCAVSIVAYRIHSSYGAWSRQWNHGWRRPYHVLVTTCSWSTNLPHFGNCRCGNRTRYPRHNWMRRIWLWYINTFEASSLYTTAKANWRTAFKLCCCATACGHQLVGHSCNETDSSGTWFQRTKSYDLDRGTRLANLGFVWSHASAVVAHSSWNDTCDFLDSSHSSYRYIHVHVIVNTR